MLLIRLLIRTPASDAPDMPGLRHQKIIGDFQLLLPFLSYQDAERDRLAVAPEHGIGSPI